MTKYTDWFPPEIKPVHVGVYQVDDEDGCLGEWFAYWNGARFGFRARCPNSAVSYMFLPTDLKDIVKWRGLSEKPKVGIMRASACNHIYLR